MTSDNSVLNECKRGGIVTTEILARALQYKNREEGRPLTFEEALEPARRISDIFGMSECIVSNRLDRAEMDVIYQMDSMGLIELSTEEHIIPAGPKKYKLWRVQYAYYKIKQIFEACEGQLALKAPEKLNLEQEVNKYRCYDDETLWKNRAPAA